MTNEIVKIKASDYGLEESKASEIESMFLPMLAKMRELEKEFNHILKLPINPETCQMAKDLRLSYVKIRTGTALIHKSAKDFYLKGGRFVDGWKNAQEFASGEKEEVLKKIENHFEILKAEVKAKLKAERIELVQQYVEDVNTFMLGEMTQPAFDVLLDGVKSQYFARIEAEKKAEEERLAAIEVEKKRQEQMRLDNIRLQKEAEEREKEISIERKKAEAQRKALEEKASKEAEERRKLEVEIENTKQAELKAKREADEKAEAEHKAQIIAEKKIANAPDKIKLIALADTIGKIEMPEVKSLEVAVFVADAKTLLQKVVKYLRDKAETI